MDSNDIIDAFDDLHVISKLFAKASGQQRDKGVAYFSAPDIDLSIYDIIVVCISGGKDSWASLLRLIDMGADMSKIELWHHEVDGREGSALMDWPFMTDYNRKLAAAFGLPIYFSWLEGGFEGEMLKENSFSNRHHIETPSGLITLERDTIRAKPGTRLLFPQVSKDLKVRWCSSALKIEVGRRSLNNQPRFNGKKVLFVTGERRDEGGNRRNYNQLESHPCDRRTGSLSRHVDAWRPVLEWSEEQVWDAMRQHGVLSPVPYRLGWSRSSCMKCIFNKDVIWSTLNHYFPGSIDKIADYETRFGKTISHDRINVLDLAKTVAPLEIGDKEALMQAMEKEYTLPIVDTRSEWILPAGAFSKVASGPS